MRYLTKAILSALFCLFLLPQAVVAEQAVPSITVGVLLSFSGGLEQWCSYIQKGIELAASEDGGIKVNLKFEDDHSVDRKTVAIAAHKLIDIDKVDMLFSWTASTITVLVPIATKAGIPLLVGAYDHKIDSGGPNVFGGFVNYDLMPREIAQFFVNTKGAKRLALLMAADDWSANFEKPFKEEALRLGATVVLTETVSSTETNMRSLIVKLRDLKIDATLAPLYAESLYAFLKQSRELHYPGMIHVGDGMFEEDLKIAGPSAEGVYAAQTWIDSPELSKLFKDRYGQNTNPLQLGLVAIGYDWVKHLKGATEKSLQEGKALSPKTIRDSLATFTSHGFTGEQMYGAPPKQSGVIMMVVKDGRYTPAN